MNSTTIVLLPKKPKPKRISYFSPINLCNVVYKIIAKAVANRLKCVLPTVISNSYSAFVPGRMIIDNIMIVFEINHYLKRK